MSLCCATPWSHHDGEWRCSIPGCGCGGAESLHGCQGSPTSSVGIVPWQSWEGAGEASLPHPNLSWERGAIPHQPSGPMGQLGISWDLSAHPWRLCQSDQPVPSSLLEAGICHCHTKSWVWDVIHTSGPSLTQQGAHGLQAQGVAVTQPHLARCEERRKRQSWEQGRTNPDCSGITPGHTSSSCCSCCWLCIHQGQLRSLNAPQPPGCSGNSVPGSKNAKIL